MKKIMLLAFWLLSLVALKAQNGNEPMKVTDLLRVRTLGTLSLNKDGSKALFTVLSTEPDGDSKLEFKNNTQIWLANTDGSAEPKQLTGKDNAFQAVFSPDGKQIAFVRAVEGKHRLFIAIDGGEAIRSPGIRLQPALPDGKKILQHPSHSKIC
jgi:Tol biopolymer transport system component